MNNDFDDILKEFMIDLDNLNKWNQLNLELCINTFIKNKRIKFTFLGQPLRIILTNMKNGPAISQILDILGKKNTFLRLNKYINRTF